MLQNVERLTEVGIWFIHFKHIVMYYSLCVPVDLNIILSKPQKIDRCQKKIPAKKLWIECSTNNVSTNEQRENSRADTSPIPSKSSLSATLRGKNNDILIRSGKNLISRKIGIISIEIN